MKVGPRPLGRARTAYLLATVFASGAAVMILEMTAVRAVQPFFGSTTYVWTNVIAVVLAALAVGYALGGRLAERTTSPRLLYGLLGVGGLLVGAGALLVTPVARLFLHEGLDLEGVVSVLLWGSLGTTLALFAPPILLLGMVSPIAVRLLAGLGVGRAAGGVLAFSTAGSILGTYLPTLVLVPHLGSRAAILVAAALLLLTSAAGLLLFGAHPSKLRAGLLLATALGACLAAGSRLARPGRPAPPLHGGTSSVLAEIESPYQYLTVRDDAWDDGVDRVLTINEGVYSFHALRTDDRVLTGSDAYDAYAVLPRLLDLSAGSRLDACVLGSACGINAAQWHHFFGRRHALRVEGAEIDPEVTRLGRRYFGLPETAPWLEVRDLDGRALLACAPSGRRYDLIVVDAFANELYVPFHLATREFFELCRRRLTPGGLLAMNVYARGAGAPNRAAIERTMTAVFPAVVRIPHGDTGTSLLLAGGGEPSADALAERFLRTLGEGQEVPRDAPTEWPALERLGVRMASTVVPVPPPGPPGRGPAVLTDDHAPLAWLTDQSLDAAERALAGAGDARSEELLALRRRQRVLVAILAAAWATALLVLGRLLSGSPVATSAESGG
jgi:spermidine synthase